MFKTKNIGIQCCCGFKVISPFSPFELSNPILFYIFEICLAMKNIIKTWFTIVASNFQPNISKSGEVGIKNFKLAEAFHTHTTSKKLKLFQHEGI
jgi:hypothetical protein